MKRGRRKPARVLQLDSVQTRAFAPAPLHCAAHQIFLNPQPENLVSTAGRILVPMLNPPGAAPNGSGRKVEKKHSKKNSRVRSSVSMMKGTSGTSISIISQRAWIRKKRNELAIHKPRPHTVPIFQLPPPSKLPRSASR